MATYKYFKHINNSTTIEDIKAQYRVLAIENHPDNGGSDEVMAQINAEYTALCKRYGHIHNAENGSTYEAETTENPEHFINVISALIRLNVDFRLVGSWIWISGNTYNVKEDLKMLGAKWSGKHKEWYIVPDGQKRRKFNSGKTMDEIESTHGVSYRFEHKDGIMVA